MPPTPNGGSILLGQIAVVINMRGRWHASFSRQPVGIGLVPRTSHPSEHREVPFFALSAFDRRHDLALEADNAKGGSSYSEALPIPEARRLTGTGTRARLASESSRNRACEAGIDRRQARVSHGAPCAPVTGDKKMPRENRGALSQILPGGDLLFHTTMMQYHRP